MKRHPPLWQLVVAQLDISQLEYSTTEIARLLGRQAWAVRYWSRQMFPRVTTQRQIYYFDFAEAVLLIRKICQNGRCLPDSVTLYRELLDAGVIDERFPDNHPNVVAAKTVFLRYHAQRTNALTLRPSSRLLQPRRTAAAL